MKDRNLNIRINSDLLDKAKKQAEKENRTLSNYVTTLIKNDIEKEEKEMKLENLELTQEAYITGVKGSEYYEANAIDKDNNEYLVKWDIKEEYKDMLNEIDDESMLCDWDNPTSITKL